MSISTLLTNDLILDKLVGLIDEKSGNVSSVSGTAPIVVAPTAGDCVVSLTTGSYLDVSNNALTLNISNEGTTGQILAKSATSGELEWVDDNAGETYTGEAPISVAGSVISLPISGTWSINNNVVKSSAENVLMWGQDGEGVAPTGGFGISVSPEVVVALNVALPAENGQILSSTTEGVLSWVNDTAGGIVDKVVAGQFISVDETAPAEPIVSLNVGLPAESGYVLSSTTEGVLSWIVDNAGGQVNSIVAGDFIAVDETNPVEPAVRLNVGMPAQDGYVLSSTTAGALSWIADDAGGQVNKVVAGDFMTVDETNPVEPSVALNVGMPAQDGYVLSSTTAGALSWIADDAGGQVNKVVAGDFIAVDETNPVEPAVRLNVGMPAQDGYVLSSSTAGTLSWVQNQPYSVIEFTTNPIPSSSPVVLTGVEYSLLTPNFTIPLQINDIVSIGANVNFTSTGGAESIVAVYIAIEKDGNPLSTGENILSEVVQSGHTTGIGSTLTFQITEAGTYTRQVSATYTIGGGATLSIANAYMWLKVERGAI